MTQIKAAKPPLPDSVTNFDAMPGSAYVRLPTVCALLEISKPTVWRWARKGILPAPKRLGPRACGFNVAELREFMAKK